MCNNKGGWNRVEQKVDGIENSVYVNDRGYQYIVTK